MRPITVVLMAWLCLSGLSAYGQMRFDDFDAFVQYAMQRSIRLKKGDIEISQAKTARLVAILEMFEPSGSTSLSYRNNMQLPVTLVPSQLLGGQPGNFERVQFGLQYETQSVFNGELKLLHPAGWKSPKLSRLHWMRKTHQQVITQKELFHDAAVLYYEILSLQAQKQAAERNAQVADTIGRLVLSMLEQGLSTQQEVNEAQSNALELARSLRQISYQITQQTNALKLLFDIPQEEQMEIGESSDIPLSVSKADVSRLMIKQFELDEQIAYHSFQRQKRLQMPSLSLFYSRSNQQFNQRAVLTDPNSSWIPSSYVGLRLQIPLPSAQLISQQVTAKYTHLLAVQQRQQAEIRAGHEAERLSNAHDYATAKLESDLAIFQLKKDTYQKDQLNYAAGLVRLSEVLGSFQQMVNAEYHWQASRIALQLAVRQINIHNQFE